MDPAEQTPNRSAAPRSGRPDGISRLGEAGGSSGAGDRNGRRHQAVGREPCVRGAAAGEVRRVSGTGIRQDRLDAARRAPAGWAVDLSDGNARYRNGLALAPEISKILVFS